MADMKGILAYLKDNQAEMVSCLEKLTNMDSPSTEKSYLDRFSSELASMWREVGAQVETIPMDKYGNHLRVTWGTGEEKILVLCHMDTVWDAGETAKRPFRVENNIAFGPGAYDMKGGIVEAIYAIKAISSLGLETKNRVVILHNSDEEIGSPSSRPIIEEEARSSKAVLVLEPSAKGGALKTWRKGVGMFQITIRGREAHAGSDYERGVSAILEAAHQVIWLQGLTDMDDGTTVNVGTIKGGTRKNVVPGEVSMGVDLRVKTMEAAERLTNKILGMRPRDPRITLKVEGGLNRPPMERNEKNVGLFRIARAIGQEMGLDLEESGTGGGSDGNFTSALGIPTLDGLGPVGDEGHAPGEYVLVSSLPERTAVLTGLLLRI